ncbi:hypothetical protein N7491_008226 [Penicillium cf. griseofulvum]|uniref:Uncharacterized protein n=1 Tax=Penicillium cf. griseofulvum TaxID=2972120 RepID=A0A9W9M5Q9_9EURO|nr:hypothetical protein N7472_008743 [Penicillium cf. griseofulvum]KAJ5427784.1 hypothetical protein N7491_008226 [Penicillium cf. griseofulvum]
MAESTAAASFPLGPPAGPPTGRASEPLIVFVARAAPPRVYDELDQLKYYIRPALLELREAYERKYGNLENRTYIYCPLIHKSVTPLDQACDSFLSMTDILMYARDYDRDIMFMLAHWDSITSDTSSFASIFEDFTDVNVTIRVFGSLSVDHYREFHDFDAHRVGAHYQGLIRLEEEFVIDDALRFVVRLEEIRSVRIRVEESVGIMVRATGRPEAELYESVLWML